MVVILAERAADERRADAGERLDLIVAGVYVRDDLVGSQGIVVVVRIGMVHQLVAALNDGLGLLGVLVRPVADNEKGTLHAVVREHIKDLLRVVRTPGRRQNAATLYSSGFAAFLNMPLFYNGWAYFARAFLNTCKINLF